MTDYTQRRPYNAVADFVDPNVARGLGGKLAFSDGSRTLTYAELQAATSGSLTGCARFGFRQEARIALLMLDTVDCPGRVLGRDPRRRRLPIPLNTLLNAEQYGYMLDDSRVEAVFVSAPLAKTIAPIIDRLPRLRTDRHRRRGRGQGRFRPARSPVVRGGAVARPDMTPGPPRR